MVETEQTIWEFPQIRGTLLGVPMKRVIVFWVYIGVPLLWETTIFFVRSTTTRGTLNVPLY